MLLSNLTILPLHVATVGWLVFSYRLGTYSSKKEEKKKYLRNWVLESIRTQRNRNPTPSSGAEMQTGTAAKNYQKHEYKLTYLGIFIQN